MRQRRRLVSPGFLAYTLPILAALPAGAQPSGSRPADVSGEPPKVIYSVNRIPDRPFDTARGVEVITREEIWRRNARTLPELLIDVAGVFVQQTNYGGGQDDAFPSTLRFRRLNHAFFATNIA